ncbi:MAG: cell division protein ZapA [Bernardetiaceae bacterium]|jgi:cell division protein ZapA|nr:cell division protein ZapA [Bernardetiaceae bacterium]
MPEQTVKLTIAERDYTLRVAAEEVPLLMQAAERVNEQVREKKNAMRVFDKQDLLAMVAFDAVYEELLREEADEKLAQQMAHLEALIPPEFA